MESERRAASVAGVSERSQRSPARSERDASVLPPTAEVVCGQARFALSGRVLLLVLWLARHQERINALAPEAGQVWMSWKGTGGQSISGDLKTPL